MQAAPEPKKAAAAAKPAAPKKNGTAKPKKAAAPKPKPAAPKKNGTAKPKKAAAPKAKAAPTKKASSSVSRFAAAVSLTPVLPAAGCRQAQGDEEGRGRQEGVRILFSA